MVTDTLLTILQHDPLSLGDGSIVSAARDGQFVYTKDANTRRHYPIRSEVTLLAELLRLRTGLREIAGHSACCDARDTALGLLGEKPPLLDWNYPEDDE